MCVTGFWESEALFVNYPPSSIREQPLKRPILKRVNENQKYDTRAPKAYNIHAFWNFIILKKLPRNKLAKKKTKDIFLINFRLNKERFIQQIALFSFMCIPS